jgi:hypothetical protein
MLLPPRQPVPIRCLRYSLGLCPKRSAPSRDRQRSSRRVSRRIACRYSGRRKRSAPSTRGRRYREAGSRSPQPEAWRTVVLRSPGGWIMSWRNSHFVEGAVLAAATSLLLVSPVRAGPAVRAGGGVHEIERSSSQPQPAPVVRSASQPTVFSVTVTIPSAPPRKPVYVDLRGPDGQVRRFLVEGGRAAIQFQQVVLRPGQSLTIRWLTAK